MPTPSRHEGEQIFADSVRFLESPILPDESIGDDHVEAGAGIQQSKLEHQHRASYGQPNTTATTETVVLFVARAGGTVLQFVGGMVGANVGAATVTFDLKKNGTTVLTGVVTLDSADAAYATVAGTLVATPTYVAGDVFTVVITATAGGGTLGTGAFCSMTSKEDAE